MLNGLETHGPKYTSIQMIRGHLPFTHLKHNFLSLYKGLCCNAGSCSETLLGITRYLNSLDKDTSQKTVVTLVL